MPNETISSISCAFATNDSLRDLRNIRGLRQKAGEWKHLSDLRARVYVHLDALDCTHVKL